MNTLIVSIGFLFPLIVIMISFRDLMRTQIFELTSYDSNKTPFISVNIPCKDDKMELETTLQSLLSQDYSHIEIIVAIDRSPELYQSLVANEKYKQASIRFINIDTIPDNWMGKQYNLYRAHKVSNGDFILFIDAGEILAKEALHHAVGIMQKRHLDHLSVLPQIIKKTFFQKLLSLTVMIGLILHWNGISSKWIANRKYPGFGAFNMVRRRVFQQTSGYESLRMEVLDDLGVAKLIREAGGKSEWFLARRMLFREWYSSLDDAFDGFNKNMFYFFSFSVFHVLFFAAFLFLLIFSPLVLSMDYSSLTLYLAITLLGAYFLFSIVLSRYFNWGWGYWILLPIGIFIYNISLLVSMIKYFQLDGIVWKGTHYSSKEIRQNTFLGC